MYKVVQDLRERGVIYRLTRDRPFPIELKQRRKILIDKNKLFLLCSILHLFFYHDNDDHDDDDNNNT